MASPAWNAGLRPARGPQGRKRVGLQVPMAPPAWNAGLRPARGPQARKARRPARPDGAPGRERRSPIGTRPAGPPQTPRKSLLLRSSIHDPRKRGSHLGPLPQRPGSPESERVRAGSSSTLERTGRRDPGPRAAPGGAAAGTYNTFGPLPGAPPPDHDRRRDADELALLDDHGRRRIGKRRATDPHRRLAGSLRPEARSWPGSGEESTAAGPLRSRSATQLEPPPLC